MQQTKYTNNWSKASSRAEYILSFQALVKVRNAIHGVNNSRFEDLAHMVLFTHTGGLGNSLFINCGHIATSRHLATTRLPISYRIRFMACRSFLANKNFSTKGGGRGQALSGIFHYFFFF